MWGLWGKQLSAKLPHKKLGPKAMTDAIWMIESEVIFLPSIHECQGVG